MEFLGEVARKRGPSAQLAVEAAKTRVAAGLGESTGVFTVPAVLRFDADSGELDTVRLPGFVSLLDLAVGGDPRVAGLCRRAGRAAAIVHAGALPADVPRIPMPAELRSAGGAEGFVHGDLTAANVGYDTQRDALVILDWSAAPSLGSAATVGPREFDVLWFMMYFFRTRPLAALRHWAPEAWAAAFLAGYRDVSGFPSLDALREYHRAIAGFVSRDREAELARRARGARWLPYRLWRWAGWRRWMGCLASLGEPAAPAGAGR